MAIVKYPAGLLEAPSGEPRTWWINTADPKGWMEPILCVWELEAEALTAELGFDEWNYMVEGQILIEVDGVEVELNPGDAVLIPAGAFGRYTAKGYAKLFCVWGPNPNALGRTKYTYTKLSK
ncbi:cupin domain-containing protein [Acidisoma cellulosilytica]|uniref:Cupin domain-containing protein n=1 Tax=Acidisoma cellulosilyticum TaxID=2802395 RepID=A0A964E779_9PROT|nr:cupin domain-containing protein [Acidisoma cellulosilyticum]MCB8883728.1 cupin domain-containing protein [Acidisoma cellulosilyticum]